MHTKKSSQSQWDAVRAALESAHAPSSVRISKSSISHPRAAGARPTATAPVGQTGDFAIDAVPKAPLVVREFPDHFEAAVDGVNATAKVLSAIQNQPEAAMYLGAALLGGAIGSSLSTRKEGTMVGVGLGLLVAAALNASSSRRA